MLAHAEFESYLEDVVLAHLFQSVQQWKFGRAPTVSIAAVLAFTENPGRGPDSVLDPPSKPAGDFDERLRLAVNAFAYYVRNTNHGVKEKNILSLLAPIGFDTKTIDQVWLADLDSWASDRGEVAHKSGNKLTVQIDPAREKTRVNGLLQGFRKVDTQILKL